MTHIENYMDDGANWQAQCVLAILRGRQEEILDESWSKEFHRYDSRIVVGRYENDREQGYVFSIQTAHHMRNYAVYEHRNSDNICIVAWDGLTINTPTPSQVPMRDKWDVTKKYEYGEVMESADWIAKDMILTLHTQIEKWKEERNTNE